MGCPATERALATDKAAYKAVSERNARELVEASARVTSSCSTTRRPQDSLNRCDATARGSRGAATSASIRPTTSCGGRGPFCARTSRRRSRLVFSRAAYVWEGLEAHTRQRDPAVDRRLHPEEPAAPRGRSSRYCAPPASTSEGARERRCLRSPAVDGSPGRVGRQIESNGWLPLPGSAPAVVQVSRWDRLKDPAGVLQAFAEGHSTIDGGTPGAGGTEHCCGRGRS